MQFHFKEYGQGRPVILLHGLFGSSDNWHPIAVRLAEPFHVFALDHRNHGQSPHSPEMDYPVMAADVDKFFAAQGLENALVIGHSMGGKTAMQLALHFPQRVHKLVVADMAPRAYASAHDKIFAALLALELPPSSSRGANRGSARAGNPQSRLAPVPAEESGPPTRRRVLSGKSTCATSPRITGGCASRWPGRRAVRPAGVVHPRRQIQVSAAGRRAADPRVVSGAEIRTIPRPATGCTLTSPRSFCV